MDSDMDNFEQLLQDAVDVISVEADLHNFLEIACSAIHPDNLSDFDSIDLNLIDKHDLLNHSCMLRNSIDGEESPSSMSPGPDFPNEMPIFITRDYAEDTASTMRSMIDISLTADEDIDPENSIQILCNEEANESWKEMNNKNVQSTIGAKVAIEENLTEENALDEPQEAHHTTVEEIQQPKELVETHVEQNTTSDPSIINGLGGMGMEKVNSNGHQNEVLDEPEETQHTTVEEIRQPEEVQETHDEQNTTSDPSTINGHGEMAMKKMNSSSHQGEVDNSHIVSQVNNVITVKKQIQQTPQSKSKMLVKYRRTRTSERIRKLARHAIRPYLNRAAKYETKQAKKDECKDSK